MFLGVEHGGYIFTSYAFAALIFTFLIGWVWCNLRKQKTRLAALEASGATKRRRRSSKVKKKAS